MESGDIHEKAFEDVAPPVDVMMVRIRLVKLESRLTVRRYGMLTCSILGTYVLLLTIGASLNSTLIDGTRRILNASRHWRF